MLNQLRKNQEPTWGKKQFREKVQNIPVIANLQSTNQLQQYFSFRVKNKISDTDPTIAWQYNVPILSPNQKYIYLVTDTIQTVLHDFIGDNYPQSVSIGLKNFNGFIGGMGAPTNKIMVMNLYNIANYQSNGITYRDLIYRNQTTAMWPLGTLRDLIFEVYLDESSTPITMPLTNSIALAFKILHVAI